MTIVTFRSWILRLKNAMPAGHLSVQILLNHGGNKPCALWVNIVNSLYYRKIRNIAGQSASFNKVNIKLFLKMQKCGR
jgi:hypothetical protein